MPVDGVVQLAEASNGALQSLLRDPGKIVDKDGSDSSSSRNRILALTYSPDGKTLVLPAELGLKLWNPNDGKELATLLGYGMDERERQVEVTSVAFSPYGKLLAVARSPLELWDTTARKPLRQIDIYGDTTVKFFGAGARLAMISSGLNFVPRGIECPPSVAS